MVLPGLDVVSNALNTVALGILSGERHPAFPPRNLLLTSLGGCCFAQRKDLQNTARIGEDGKKGNGAGRAKEENSLQGNGARGSGGRFARGVFSSTLPPAAALPAKVRLMNGNMQKAREQDSVEHSI